MSDSGPDEERGGLTLAVVALALLPVLGLGYCSSPLGSEAEDQVRYPDPVVTVVSRERGEDARQTCEQRYGTPASLCAKLRREGDKIVIPLQEPGS